MSWISRCGLLGLLLLGLSACQHGTRIAEVSSEKPEAALLKHLLVVGVDITADTQKAMEVAFSRRLAGKERRIVRASAWFPEEGQPSRQQVAERAKAEGVTGVLVTRLLSYNVDDAAQPPAFSFSLALPPRTMGERSPWAQDPWINGQLPAPGKETALATRKAYVETRLYDAVTGQVMWEARSYTVMTDEERPDFDGFAAAIATQLRHSGWLPR